MDTVDRAVATKNTSRWLDAESNATPEYFEEKRIHPFQSSLITRERRPS